MLLPTITLPKLRLVGLGDKVPADIPVPDNGKLRVELEAFEIRFTVPLAFPVVWGAKVTVKAVLWEGFSVSGVVIPPI